MSKDTTLLFLHGIGDGDKEDTWVPVLDATLVELGYPGLHAVTVVSPKYAHALKGWDEKQPLPRVTSKPVTGERAKLNRRDFERRVGALEIRLGRANRGNGYVSGDAIVQAAVRAGEAGLPRVSQAANYLNDPQIRAQVLRHILSQLPETGELVIIGYSLGSVIAADLINRLPVGVSVAGMVTIGSPLAHGGFDVDKLRDSLKDPPANLAWWVNFWNTTDPIAAHRGISSVFPWLIDFRVDSPRLLIGAHEASEYLADETVAKAVGFALFGSISKDLVAIETSAAIPLDAAELMAILALRYAHILAASLTGDKGDRFMGALRQVQAAAVEDIRERNDAAGRPMPTDVARLFFDIADADSPLPEPQPIRELSKEQAALMLTVLAAENVIRPFEISVPRDHWLQAMKDLTAEMGLTSLFGADVFAAAKTAQDALAPDRSYGWVKWGALGVGAAALIAATGGLALAAAPGLAGAAAITSALAAFGPGGMIGGLLTAGTLVSVGGGGVALGLASSGTSAETVEAFVVRRLAATILRDLRQLEPDPTTWVILSETEIALRREYARLDEFSDPSAPSLKELLRKVETIERALAYLRMHGHEPGVPATAPALSKHGRSRGART